ncbi:MAG: glycosyltransferase [Hyphomicrobiales bacterium]|nr:glycosyltransferase [Hyphomicrobiales bacterium]
MEPFVSSAPLTIVIVVDHASVTGGQAKVAFDSAVGLKAAGHRPIVFAAAGPVDPKYAQSDIEIVCLDQADLLGASSKAAGALQGVWNARAAQALGVLLKGLPKASTIVHVHGWAKAVSPSIAVPIRESGLPAVYTFHEFFLYCPNGGFYNYQKNEVCHLRAMSADCLTTNCDSVSYARKVWRSARLGFAHGPMGFPRVFSDFIRISKVQAGVLAPYLPKDARLHLVSNPIEAEDLGPKEDAASGDIAFVARISPEKGPFLFAEAARIAGVQAVFVGDGPAAAQLKARYPEARILGWQPADAARAALRKARALVFPSLWYEGQPLTVLEAKAAGTPVIVSDVCAGRESIENGKQGLWFKSNDAQDLARALMRMKDDDTVRAMSREAYADYWRDPPTLDRHVQRILTIYRGMIERREAA